MPHLVLRLAPRTTHRPVASMSGARWGFVAAAAACLALVSVQRPASADCTVIGGGTVAAPGDGSTITCSNSGGAETTGIGSGTPANDNTIDVFNLGVIDTRTGMTGDNTITVLDGANIDVSGILVSDADGINARDRAGILLRPSATIASDADGIEIRSDGFVDNLGRITATGAGSAGIAGTLGGVRNFVKNQGFIVSEGSAGFGVRLFDENEFENTPGASVTGEGFGLFVRDDNRLMGESGRDSVALENRGEIRANASDGIGVRLGQNNAFLNDTGGIVISGELGLSVDGSFNDIWNEAGAVIAGSVQAIELRGLDNRMWNSGAVQGGSGPALSFETDLHNVYNFGTLQTGGTNAVIFQPGAGLNTLVLGTGSDIIGNVLGDFSGIATGNVVRLEGIGNENADFEDLDTLVFAGQDWTVSGDLDFDRVNLDSSNGTLEIRGLLDALTSINVPDGSDVRLLGNGVVNGGLMGTEIEGRLEMNMGLGVGSFLSDVVVQDGGLLTGIGVITGDVSGNGTVAPGTSIGTLTIDGDYNPGSDATLEIEVDEPGNSDLLIVTGNADLDGTLLLVADTAGLGDFVDVAVVAGSISGFFDEVKSPRAIAGAVLGTSGPFETVLVGVVSPSNLDARVDAALDGGFLFLGNLTSRLQGLRDGTATSTSHLGGVAPLLASTDGSLAASLATQLAGFSGPTRPQKTEGGPGLWVRGVGWYGGRDAEDNVLGYDNTLAGVVVGGDWAIGETGFVVGAGFNYTRAWADVDASSSRNDADNYLFGAYLGYDRSNYFVDVAIGGGFSNYDSRRRTVVGGTPRTAKADFDGTNFAVRTAGGMDFTIGELFTVRPVVSLDYVWVSQDGYNESGGGLGSLSLADNDAHALKVQGLAVLTQSYGIGSDMKLIPEFRTGVVGQFVLGDRDVNSALPNLAATGVLVGNDSHEVRAAVGAGVTLQMGNALSAYIDLGGELGTDTRNATAGGGVRWIF